MKEHHYELKKPVTHIHGVLFVFLRSFLRSESARSRRCIFRKAGRHAEATAAPLAWKQLKQQRDKIYIYCTEHFFIIRENTKSMRGLEADGRGRRRGWFMQTGFSSCGLNLVPAAVLSESTEVKTRLRSLMDLQLFWPFWRKSHFYHEWRSRTTTFPTKWKCLREDPAHHRFSQHPTAAAAAAATGDLQELELGLPGHSRFRVQRFVRSGHVVQRHMDLGVGKNFAIFNIYR